MESLESIHVRGVIFVAFIHHNGFLCDRHCGQVPTCTLLHMGCLWFTAADAAAPSFNRSDAEVETYRR